MNVRILRCVYTFRDRTKYFPNSEIIQIVYFIILLYNININAIFNADKITHVY